ncbi:hypothetical protein HCN44_010163 [Aphidius gifuensis]|uniref:Uncharacterized protein n=1 Tax=Aphidius gifuensis TaxID=684658 RepID=A0A834XU69_APHGI|nr:hypothetical protein HCN44_010163 [Aphidius gifuensis]
MAQNNDGPSNKKKKLDNDEIKSLGDLLSIRVGKVNIGKNQKITLFVANMRMDAMNITQDNYAHLDKSLRYCENIDMDCCKYKQTIYFNIFGLDISKILKTINIEGFIDELPTTKPLSTLSTLNYYKTGDFKASHHQGYRQGLKGTLILLLPSECVGGDFCFDDDNVEKDMDKSTLRFIYFNNRLEPSVTKVLSGNRLSLVFNVYDFNHKRINVIGSNNTVIYFPDEHYKRLLDYTIDYCKGKVNILLGYYQHRDAAFNKRLRDDIGATYKVIKVVVEDSSPISQVTTVHELKDDFYDGDEPDEEKYFSDIVNEKFEVQHKLFTKYCALQFEEIGLVTQITHNEKPQLENEYSIALYTAYLINPNAEYNSHNDHDTD